MASSIHSFMDIFDSTFVEDQKTVQLNKIVIPIIQRDYAQGRLGSDIKRVRNRFLDALYKGITEEPIVLDFIYGDIDDNGIMIPLDGQQRLTTLFLLHWYAAKKDNISEEEYGFLKNFSYETRYSSRNFCIDIIDNMQKLKDTNLKNISDNIKNQAWFPFDWENDPTISSMLVMLDEIDEKFRNIENLWDKLKNKCISFYFRPIKTIGLTDELYIKMNSRGKPLTTFEHFKAELEREIRNIDEDLANEIIKKIDGDWTDLLWKYCNNSNNDLSGGNIIDDKFLHYFKFICDVICYRKNESPTNRSNDEFELLQKYFSSKCPDAKNNLETMEKFFDCWCSIPHYDSPTSFLNSFMAIKHEKDKILADKPNIFEDCINTYSDKTGRIRQFPLNKIVLLYAITIYLQNIDKIKASDFARRIRIVNNLIKNSEDEISDRSDRNRMPAILVETEKIILTGVIDDSIRNFNVSQILEEKEKIKYLETNPEKAEILFELEDHFLLNGQISIIGLDNLSYTKRFESLFKCYWDKVDCALMAIGDYGQHNKLRYQYGSAKNKFAWNELFHKKIANDGFDNTQNILKSLLAKNEEFTNNILQKISDDYLQECEQNGLYPFGYYYIKYPEFRPGSFGRMKKDSSEANTYMITIMLTKTHLSTNSYIPFLKIADDAHLSRDDYGQKLIFREENITCTNNSYIRRKNIDNTVIGSIPIAQNEKGIDTEDRIIVLKNYIKAI